MSYEVQMEQSAGESESNWAYGGGALQASSGIAMGVLLGAGTWVVLGGFTFLVMNFKTFIS